MFTKVIYWQNYPSIHQSAFVRALAARSDTEVWFAFEEDIPRDRIAMGWTMPDHGKANVVDSRDSAIWNKLVAMNDRHSLHLFGSYFDLPCAFAALRKLTGSPCIRVWTTEAFNFEGWKGQIRIWRSRLLALRYARESFDHIFAMGILGTDFFKRSWLDPSIIHEFAYLVEPPDRYEFSDTDIHSESGDARLLYVGQLINRKGVDILLRSLARLKHLPWSLQIIGDGRRRSALESCCRSLKLDHRVNFVGNQTNRQVLSAMHCADLLYLPSRWDGWGAVVNEALMMGTRVIASDRCGSSSLIVDESYGGVFSSEDVASLTECTEAALESLQAGRANRRMLAERVIKALAPDRVASYLIDTILGTNNGQSIPPWKQAE